MLYSPSQGNQQVSFSLSTFQSQAAGVTISFLNQSSLSVLRTISLPSQAPGSISVNWDGRADNGMLVAPGAYLVTVTAVDGLGNQATTPGLTTVRY